jgi:uncharacterized protein YjiS (DUF1127 family)
MSRITVHGWALFAPEIAKEEGYHPQSVSLAWLDQSLRTPLLWIARSRQRRRLGELADLNDYLLRDIGVSREEALREAAKPFWR